MESMESKPVCLSTTQGTPLLLSQAFDPRKPALSNSILFSSSLPIRAPITVDDDSDFESNDNKFDHTSRSSSESGSVSQAFVSGEEFETASERADDDDDDDDPDDDTVEESDVVDKNVVFRPFVAYGDGESLESGVEDERESTGLVDVNFKWVRPIAQLSREDDDVDDGDLVESEVEDEDSLGSIEISSLGIIEKISISPRVKLSGFVEEGKEDEIPRKSIGDSGFDSSVEAGNKFLGIKEEEKSYYHYGNVLVVDNGIGAVDVYEDPLVTNKRDVVELNSKLDADFEQFCVEKINLGDHCVVIETDTGRRDQIEDFKDSELLKEERDTLHGFGDEVHESKGSNLVDTNELKFLKSNFDAWEADNNGKYIVEEPLVSQNIKSNSVDVGGGVRLEGPYDEMPERKMDTCIDFHHVEYSSKSATLEFTNNCFEGMQNDKFSDYNQAEETVNLGECDFSETTKVDGYENALYSSFNLDDEVKVEAIVEASHDKDTVEEEKCSPVSDEEIKDLRYEGSEKYKCSEVTEWFSNEVEQMLAASHVGMEDSEDHFQQTDGHIISESDEVDKYSESKGEELLESTRLIAILNAATNVDGSNGFDVDGPTDLVSSPHSGKLRTQQTRPNTFTPSDLGLGDESEDNLNEEEKKKIEKMRLLRVKFLRLVHRLDLSLEDCTVTEVLDRLALAVGKHTSHFGTLESAMNMALYLEADNKSDLDFCLNILVLGKSGVGKSATINFIFGEKKAAISAFEPATTALKEIIGTIDGVKIRILDTPGLKVPAIEQAANQKILATISKYIKKFPPHVVLYVDRLDTQSRDNDLPLLKSITGSLGSSIWKNAIVTLTHAASAPPEGPSGLPLSPEIFVAQKSHVVLQSISTAVGNMHLMSPSFMHPIYLVENNPPLYEDSSARSQLLLLCYSIKVLSEASSISKPVNFFNWKTVLGFPIPSPSLLNLLSSLLQSRPHPKLGNNADSDTEFGSLWDPESRDEDEYDQLPLFRPLRKSQIPKLSKEQRNSYFAEYDYHVKLLQRKKWREEVERLRKIKNKGKDGSNVYHGIKEDGDQEELSPASKSVPLPIRTLPPSFDGEDPAYRYQSLDLTSQLLVMPVMETHCWDNDLGYDRVILERDFGVFGQFPAAFSVQIKKDKKELNTHLDSSVSIKQGENGSTLAGLDIQTIGTQLAYTLRGETKVKNMRINKTTAGLTVSFVGENLVKGFKIEDQIAFGKFLVFAASVGAVQSQGDTAYGANLELRRKEKDFPVAQDQSILGLSLMKWRGDMALTAAIQSQFSIGRSSKIAVHFGLNRKESGQITIRTNSSDQLQIALAGIVPIIVSIFRSIYSTN